MGAAVIRITAVALLLLLLCPLPARGEDALTATLGEELDLSGLEAVLDQLDGELEEADSELSSSSLLEQLLSDPGRIRFRDIRAGLAQLLWGRLRGSGILLGQLLLLAVLSTMLTLLKNTLGGQAAQTGRWVVYLLLLGMGASAFAPCLKQTVASVSLLNDLLLSLLPLLIPLLTALGGVSTAALLQPALLFMLSLLMQVINGLILPLITCSAVLKLCSGISPGISLGKLSALLRNTALGVQAILTTLFIAFLKLSGMTAAGGDGLAAKAVKTAAGAFIPVIGRTLADSMDTVLGTALLLKNTVGIVGALAILLICALPALQILLQALLFSLAGALIQPLGEEKLAEAVSGIGSSLLLLFAVLALCGLFAFFAVSILIGLGDMTMMLR